MLAWLGEKLARRRAARASTQAVNFQPPGGVFFDQSLGNQPNHDVLLRESLGVPDMATRAIANRISMLNPLVKVSRMTTSGTLEDEVLDDHPLKTLMDRPHPNLSRAQLLRLTAQHLVTVGEAYWLKVGSGLGVPVELHPMPPARVNPWFSEGIVQGYRVKLGSGGERDLPHDVIVRFYLPDPEDPWGSEGYLAPMGSVADASKFASQHLRAHFQHDATPKTALTASGEASDFSAGAWDNFVEKWRQSYHSRLGSKVGTPAKIPTGWELKEMAQQTGQELVPLLEFWERQLLKNFGTPRSILGEVVSGDRSSAETNQFVFDLHTISPIAHLIADGITLQLAPDFDSKIFVVFDDFVSQDKAFLLEQEKADLQNKVRSPQQVIRDRGGDPEDAPWGELPVGRLGDEPYTGEEPEPFTFTQEQPQDLEDEDEERARSRGAYWTPAAEWKRVLHRENKYTEPFKNAVGRVLREQRKSVLARLRDPDLPRARIQAEDLFDPEEWVALFERTTEPLRQAIFLDVLTQSGPALGIAPSDGGEFILTDEMVALLRRQGATMIRQVNETTGRRLARAVEPQAAEVIAGEILEGVEEGESVDAIAKRIQEVFRVRGREARTIARTEVLTASQGAQIESFRQAGVERKSWNTSRDAAVRDSHQIDGQTVAFDDVFVLADGERAEAPGVGQGGGALTAANRINCRCFVLPE